MGGLWFVGLDFAKMPAVRARGERGGEEWRSKAVCALDGTTGGDVPEPPEIPGREVIGLGLPLCLAARRRFRISLALVV
jgi:hypothetical protein